MNDVERAQEDYCAATDREYRRAAGQFFTPSWIASGMARWVVATRPEKIVDPACGFGMLLDACAREGYRGSLIGYEIDPKVVECWRNTAGQSAAYVLRQADFLENIDGTIPAAIVNPPYNRFQRRDLPGQLQLQLARTLGAVASGYTNQYALFLYVVLSRLSEGGRAAFIVPSEFLATGYGVQVKQFLLRNRRLRHLVLFDPASRVFPEAITTACVMLFDGQPGEYVDVWHLEGEQEADAFREVCGGDGMREPDACVSYRDLDATQNWQGLGRGQSDRSGFAPLGIFGNAKRGIATGANEFFVLRPSQARNLGLAPSDVVPCIASASSVPGIVVTDTHLGSLRDDDKAVYLFDGLTYPSAEGSAYISHGESQEFHQRYLTKMRRPWYRLEGRKPAPLLLAVFGREGFRVSLNRSSAVNLTAFHGFYPKAEFIQFVPLIWLYFQTTIARSAYVGQHRAYGDGLKKLEPGDWSKLHIPDWRRWDAASIANGLRLSSATLARCLEGNPVPAHDVLQEFELLIEAKRSSELAVGDEMQLSLV